MIIKMLVAAILSAGPQESSCPYSPQEWPIPSFTCAGDAGTCEWELDETCKQYADSLFVQARALAGNMACQDWQVLQSELTEELNRLMEQKQLCDSIGDVMSEPQKSFWRAKCNSDFQLGWSRATTEYSAGCLVIEAGLAVLRAEAEADYRTTMTACCQIVCDDGETVGCGDEHAGPLPPLENEFCGSPIRDTPGCTCAYFPIPTGCVKVIDEIAAAAARDRWWIRESDILAQACNQMNSSNEIYEQAIMAAEFELVACLGAIDQDWSQNFQCQMKQKCYMKYEARINGAYAVLVAEKMLIVTNIQGQQRANDVWYCIDMANACSLSCDD